MDTKMDVDVGKTPEPHQLTPATETATIPTLDGWIESLMSCKQLAENDVRRLCDRVCLDPDAEYTASQNLHIVIGKRNTTRRKQCPTRGMLKIT